mmetsp:Transcript_6803/g.11966  ORF Transcript_6803/g.11966 Transcript_6803/m.11966 type:complete len:258 (+) Transcript_6803:102-875(+)
MDWVEKKVQCQIAPPIDSDEELQKLYNWVDDIPLSKPKRNIARDFADGVLYAEVVNHFFPKLVELHNYSSANSHTQKMYNWTTLNTKVLKKLGFQIHMQDLEEVIKASPGAIERVLKVLQDRISRSQQRRDSHPRIAPSVEEVSSRVPSGNGGSGGGQQVTAPPRKSLGGGSGGDSGGSPPQSEQPRPTPPPAAAVGRVHQQEVDTELLLEKEHQIAELREMIVIMSEKIKKLEQLVRIKDTKIDALNEKLRKYGLT